MNLFHYLSASNVHIDKERPSTSREDNSSHRQQQCDSSESVQIIESVQNSDVGSSSEEIVEISSGNQTKSSSSDSVQIIENARTSDDESSTGRTKLKRKQTEENSSESVEIIKCVKTSKESHLKRRQLKGLRTDAQNTDISKTVDKAGDEGQEDFGIQSAQNTGTVETESSVERQSGSLPRCMMKTATGKG